MVISLGAVRRYEFTNQGPFCGVDRRDRVEVRNDRVATEPVGCVGVEREGIRMAFGERLTKGANLAHALSRHLHVERISNHILRWRRRVGAARPPGKCTFERISPDAKVNRIRAKGELLAGRLCATARQHTLELLVLGKEINPAADESEGPASSAIDHGVADQLHDLGAGIDERRITGCVDLGSRDLHLTRCVDQAIAVHEDCVGDNLDRGLFLSRRVTLDNRHRRPTRRERLRPGANARNGAAIVDLRANEGRSSWQTSMDVPGGDNVLVGGVIREIVGCQRQSRLVVAHVADEEVALFVAIELGAVRLERYATTRTTHNESATDEVVVLFAGKLDGRNAGHRQLLHCAARAILAVCFASDQSDRGQRDEECVSHHEPGSVIGALPPHIRRHLKCVRFGSAVKPMPRCSLSPALRAKVVSLVTSLAS